MYIFVMECMNVIAYTYVQYVHMNITTHCTCNIICIHTYVANSLYITYRYVRMHTYLLHCVATITDKTFCKRDSNFRKS